ncbi:arsinothricin resistance N-acetyltransferase ArsN1 family B [Mycobacterium paraseoulense]|uniref:GNAT family N-acetyltransferase n=1 Tax=Mycobacterium paraseoulense TaxID=590652 RepID=A0A1X0IB63_9MYCO|nr:arsinothricin resistance N-acetyltransferase ArsN1 family B [Mycobacterium paraseoulense]MCV7398479.1 N-acetyltransferase [Mycobacterium paraseoulense]ORB41588.1 GNAT family N-acetyltransferase [Mycobacterium paraseoulense]BBZ69240.1 N-acetyltransferase [Mycobacterium paraseoulense]
MATPDDADAIADIYAPYVRDSAISFEAAPPKAQEMRSRLSATLTDLPWLVITHADVVRGYAYASPHGERAAYRWSVDVSIYLDGSSRRKGNGRRTYSALLNLLAAQGYINAFAAIALPNPASVGLHESMGFACVGVFDGVGFKNGAWWDIGWWRCRLAERPGRPSDPLPWSQLPTRTIEAALRARPMSVDAGGTAGRAL